VVVKLMPIKPLAILAVYIATLAQKRCRINIAAIFGWRSSAGEYQRIEDTLGKPDKPKSES